MRPVMAWTSSTAGMTPRLAISRTTATNTAARWSMTLDSRHLRFMGGSSTLLQGLSSSLSASKAAIPIIPEAAASLLAGLTSSSSSTQLSPVDVESSAVVGLGHRSPTKQHPKIRTFMSSAMTAATTLSNGTTMVSQQQTFSFSSTSSTAELPEKPREGFGPSIQLSEEEIRLFSLLRRVRKETHLDTTLRVAGGWVRDKLLATPEFQTYHKIFDVGGKRLTSKFHKPAAPSLGRQGTKVLVSDNDETSQPVDIDIALDDMLGREFADHLNEYLQEIGEDTVSVGVVLKNPEKSKHLETATMKVESFWIDFVNLRAEEYTQDSRIPDLMRIGTAAEDAFRRDLTINALFYNINTGQVEDWTGRGFDDLRKGVVATPLAPLTTLLDDPLRVLRSIRFAARLRFNMDQDLIQAAMDDRVRTALAQKVSRERVGGEVDLMLRSPDPVGAMRLLINLNLADTVFPMAQYFLSSSQQESASAAAASSSSSSSVIPAIFKEGLNNLSVTYDYLADCRLSPPLWCLNKTPIYGGTEMRLTEDDEARRLLWYSAFLKPLWTYSKLLQENAGQQVSKRQGKKANRSIISKLLVDDLKRPARDAEAVEKIIKAADDFTRLVEDSGCDVSATVILLSDVRVTSRPAASVDSDNDNDDDDEEPPRQLLCSMAGRMVDSVTEDDPVWVHAMEFRQMCSNVLQRVGPLWRAGIMLSIAEQLASVEHGSHSLDYAIEGDIVQESQDERRQGVIERFDAFAAALQQLGLIGISNEKPLLDGGAMKKVLPRIPKGPIFREVMDEQMRWMVSHPGGSADALKIHMVQVFPEFAPTTNGAADE